VYVAAIFTSAVYVLENFYEQYRVKIILNANLMQQGNFMNVFLARHVSGT